VIVNTRNPRPPVRCRGQVCENRGVLYGNLFLIVIAIRHPSLHRGAVQRSGDEPPMKRVLVVVTLLADGVKPRDEIGIGRRYGG
jgi:hypothetical protein